MLSTRQSTQGFTLVELSIVLVIIGLLMGGLMGGKALIRGAELRGYTKDYETIRIALFTFIDNYHAIPGDMPNAEEVWGTDPHGCPSNAVQTPRKETCNGDGNRRIHSTVHTGATIYERFRAWQHLANAGLIEGVYSGVTGPNNENHYVPGINAPATPLDNYYAIQFFGNYSSTHNFPSDYGHIIRTIGGNTSAVYDFTPKELWNIDTKMDDGLPGYGRVIAAPRNGSCTTTTDPDTAVYPRNVKSRVCSASVKTGVIYD